MKNDNFRISNTTLEKLPEVVGEQLEKQKKEGHGNQEVKVIVGKRATAKTKAPYAILFYKNLLNYLLNGRVSNTDIKVILCILDFVGKGNVVSLVHAEIGGILGMKRQQVSRSIKNLTECDFLLKSEKGSLFINPKLMVRENLHDIKESFAYEVAKKLTEEVGDVMPY